jgi:hypothetical protein
MKRALSILVGFISLSSLSFHALPSFAGGTQAGTHFLTLTYNLEQMVAEADRIFVGTVIDATEDYVYAAGGEIPVTVYTFEVDEVLSGSIGDTVTIRQIGHQSDPFGQGMPRYEVGKTVMLFLHADSQYGLTSPVGLGQGAFQVKMDGPVKVSVSNARRNRELLKGSPRLDALFRAELPEIPYRLKAVKGDLPYKDFRTLVIRLLQP